MILDYIAGFAREFRQGRAQTRNILHLLDPARPVKAGEANQQRKFIFRQHPLDDVFHIVRVRPDRDGSGENQTVEVLETLVIPGPCRQVDCLGSVDHGKPGAVQQVPNSTAIAMLNVNLGIGDIVVDDIVFPGYGFQLVDHYSLNEHMVQRNAFRAEGRDAICVGMGIRAVNRPRKSVVGEELEDQNLCLRAWAGARAHRIFTQQAARNLSRLPAFTQIYVSHRQRDIEVGMLFRSAGCDLQYLFRLFIPLQFDQDLTRQQHGLEAANPLTNCG